MRIPLWVKIVAGIAIATKTFDALTLLVYPAALIPSRTTGVDSLYLAHRIVSTDIALATILIFALVKKSRLMLGCTLLALIANEGLDAINLFVNYQNGNLQTPALMGAIGGVVFASLYALAGKYLLTHPENA